MLRKTWILLTGFMVCAAAAGLLRPCEAQVRLPGRGLYLVGAGDYMDVGGASAMSFGEKSPYTIEAWVKTTSGGIVLSKFNSDVGGGYFLRVWPDGKVVHRREASRLVSKDPLVFGQYTHIAISYDGVNAHVLVNGRRTSQAIGEQKADTATPVWIGARAPYSDPFSGVIDEVRVWNRALSDEEIQRHIQEVSLGPDRAGLVGYWNFDELDANGRVPDLSGQGHHGVLRGRARLMNHETLAMVGGEDLPVTLPGGQKMDFMWIPPGGGVVQGFYMSKYEVTYAQYVGVMGENSLIDYPGSRQPSFPVVVSWVNASSFVSALNRAVGDSLYRLPRNGEWEYACRENAGRLWSFGNNAGEMKEYSWYADNAGNNLHEVGLKKPDRWGLHDMHGNAAEWVDGPWKYEPNRNLAGILSSHVEDVRDLRRGGQPYRVNRTPALGSTRKAMTWEAWVHAPSGHYRMITIVAWGKQESEDIPGTRLFLHGPNPSASIGATLVAEDGRILSMPVGARLGGGWNHVALTYDGAMARLFQHIYDGYRYMDDGFGGQRDSVYVGGPLKMSDQLIIGGSSLDDKGAAGFVDDVRIWNQALSDESIRKNMIFELSKDLHPNLVAYFTFNNQEEGVFPSQIGGPWLGWRYLDRFLKGGNVASSPDQSRCVVEESLVSGEWPNYDPYGPAKKGYLEPWPWKLAGFRIVKIK